MTATPLAVLSVGLVTNVGLSAPAACAAIRAKIRRPSETCFLDTNGEWIVGCPVPLNGGAPWSAKLATMASMAIEECIAPLVDQDAESIPMCLCLSEKTRPGLDSERQDAACRDIVARANLRVAARDSVVISQGRASVGFALDWARRQIFSERKQHALIVAVDSLLTRATLEALEHQERLLTSRNHNGFLPGEAAAAILVGRPGNGPQLVCRGIGFGTETAPVASMEPSRADGLVAAIRSGLADAGCRADELDFRITDLSGEHYYFREAAHALTKVLRSRKEAFDLWHAAECTGEVGAAAGLIAIAVANAACGKGYAPGPNVLLHAGSDDGVRTAIILSHGAVG